MDGGQQPGNGVERCGVFTGTRGRQLAGRCELISTGAFPYREEWAQLIAALEATLVRGAAIRDILGGQEALTRLPRGRAPGAVSNS